MHLKSRLLVLLGPALSLLLLVGTACAGYGNVETVAKTVDAQGARTVNASFAIGSGEIDVQGGADPLLQASFTTNNRRIPKVSYQVNDGVGSIKTTQSSQSSGLNIGPTTNHWAITLNDDIPLGLTVNSQSAKTTLVLDTLTIQTLDVSTDSGAATVGLSGVQNQLNAVSLRSASGDLHLTMAGDYGSPASLEVNSSSGSVNAELSGKWQEQLNGKFVSDSGSITITVPKTLGVRVTTMTDSGYVDARDLNSQGQGVYTLNPNQPIMLNLSVMTSKGNITLRTAP